jgi:hypothetical protein
MDDFIRTLKMLLESADPNITVTQSLRCDGKPLLDERPTEERGNRDADRKLEDFPRST